MIEVELYAGQKVAIFGLGGSGLATAKALMAGRAKVLAWDDNPVGREKAAAAGVPLVDLYEDSWDGVQCLVLAPGIPFTHPKPHTLVLKAKLMGVEVIGDIELFSRAHLPSRIVTITGTNGKSTTTALVGHILKEAQVAVQIGGNLGTPALALDRLDSKGVYVLELSSFQLDLTRGLVSDVAVMLNVSPDHLDRHGDMARYVLVKKGIFSGQCHEQVAVIGTDDSECHGVYRDLRIENRSQVVPVSMNKPVAGGVYVAEGQLYDAQEGTGVAIMRVDDLQYLPGRHNAQNISAAYAVCRALGVERHHIVAGIKSFGGLEHRIERVEEIDGVLFINDSKATNAEATARALDCYQNIHWIVGGKAKSDGLEGLDAYYPNINHAYLIGEAADRFDDEIGEALAKSKHDGLESAVRAAFKAAQKDLADGKEEPAVVLSPACASFDMFKNFEERGKAFKAIVAALKEA